jgi:hypothetical protein
MNPSKEEFIRKLKERARELSLEKDIEEEFRRPSTPPSVCNGTRGRGRPPKPTPVEDEIFEDQEDYY